MNSYGIWYSYVHVHQTESFLLIEVVIFYSNVDKGAWTISDIKKVGQIYAIGK